MQKGVPFGWSTMMAQLDPATAGLAEIEQQFLVEDGEVYRVALRYVPFGLQ